jgi:hypothetical protein
LIQIRKQEPIPLSKDEELKEENGGGSSGDKDNKTKKKSF